MKKILIILLILAIIVISGCKVELGDKCNLNDDCSGINCLCESIQSTVCLPECVDKKCECVNYDTFKDMKELCEKASGEVKQFPNTCVDSCEYERDEEIMCGQALTDGCDCGPDKCWNGQSCEPN